MTEKEKMLAGMVYSAVDQQLLEELNAAKEVIHKYNSLSPADAVVGIDVDYEVLGEGGGMLMVTASGTAVKLGY